MFMEEYSGFLLENFVFFDNFHDIFFHKGVTMQKFRNSILLLITFSTIFLLFSSSYLLSQEADNNSEITQEQTSHIKNIFFDLGYGGRGVSFGLGFRWWNFSAGLGLAGILSYVPKYRYPGIGEPNPMFGNSTSFSDAEKFPSTTVSFDFSYYYDISDFSIFATLGYYVQSDSVFKKYLGSQSEPDKNNYIGNYYSVGSANETGLAWGLGLQYFITENINTALAYHNKKGIYLQIGYFWY